MNHHNALFERILLLKNVPYFALLRTDQLRHLAEALEPVEWPGGEIVFERGEAGDAMFVIVKGRVGISASEKPPYDEFVVTLRHGDFFGEMAILDDQPRSAAAITVEGTEAYRLGKEKTRSLLLAYPELATGMLRAMSRRLRENRQLLDDCKARLAGGRKDKVT